MNAPKMRPLIAALAGLVALLTALPALAEVKIQEVTTPKGIKAWLVEEHSIPFAALELRFKGGTSLDLAMTWVTTRSRSRPASSARTATRRANCCGPR